MRDESAKTRVVVIFGGVSGEHSVSCASAAGILREIDRKRFDVLPLGITKTGEWVRVPDEPSQLEGGQAEVDSLRLGSSSVVVDPGRNRLVEIDEDKATDLGRVDVVLPLLHGPFGEDGTLQGLLEMTGLRYAGTGVLASAVGMDKHYTKIAITEAGLPVARHVLVTERGWTEGATELLTECRDLGLPVFVKPSRAGSSLGVTKVSAWDELAPAIENARTHDSRVLVEEAVNGREIECAVIGGRGGGATRVAPVGEVVMHSDQAEFYDFETKYFDADGFSMVCPADLPSEVVKQLQEAAARTFDALTCEGLTRVDFFVRPDGSFVVNEVNTMPGFTPFSMFPLMWENAGLSYQDLVTELLELAIERPLGLR